MEERGADWKTLQALWSLVVEAFAYPNAPMAERMRSGSWIEELERSMATIGRSLPDSASAVKSQLSSLSPDRAFGELRKEATRLFVGAPDPACSPYEGFWRCRSKGVRHFQFVNEFSMGVERFCADCGLRRPDGTNEPLDHIATECEILSYLAWRAQSAGGEQAGYPGGSAPAAYTLFLQEHLMQWLPGFAEELRSRAVFGHLPLAADIALEIAAL